MKVALSPTLGINESVRRLIARGRPVLHFGFGEAGLPAHPLLRQALATAPADNSYAPVAGDPGLREAIAGYFDRRGLATDPSRVVVAPGSKALLFALIHALPGDVLLPQPSWVSYGPQTVLAGKRAFRVPIPEEAGGVPDPDRLREAVGRARAEGAAPGVLIITQPDNPTGTLAGRDLLDAVAAIAREEDLAIVADEIYRDLAYDPTSFVSIAEIVPERTVITSGLSKSLALGGWRIGVMRAPDNDLGRSAVEGVCALGSEVWSCLPSPLVPVARLAFEEPAEILSHIEASRKVHQSVAQRAFEAVTEAGAACRRPQGAFYLYPDLGAHADRLAERGIATGRDLADALLERFDIAVLEGRAFGDGDALRFRMSTSLLYGTTDEERWATLTTLSADQGAHVPAIDAAIARLGEALATVIRG
jgi:aspartate aminotransferase